MCPTYLFPDNQDSFKNASLNRPSTYKLSEIKKKKKKVEAKASLPATKRWHKAVDTCMWTLDLEQMDF